MVIDGFIIGLGAGVGVIFAIAFVIFGLSIMGDLAQKSDKNK